MTVIILIYKVKFVAFHGLVASVFFIPLNTFRKSQKNFCSLSIEIKLSMLGKYKVKVKVAIVKSQLSKRVKIIMSESRPSLATYHTYR